jgi:hypothetical protein
LGAIVQAILTVGAITVGPRSRFPTLSKLMTVQHAIMDHKKPAEAGLVQLRKKNLEKANFTLPG